MRLILDYRETKLRTLLPTACVENLPVGDIVIEGDDGVPLVVIERKTMSDLMSSIGDGRYAEQKCRLLASPGKACYIIENYHAWSSVPNAAVQTIVMNLQLVHGFAVLTSRNEMETADIINHMFAKVKENPSKYVPATCETSYASSVKIKKADNLDAKTCAVLQLCAIRRVTAKTAETMLETFSAGCMADFITAIAAVGKVDFISRVAQLKPPGAAKKIGEKLAADVYATLFNA
jgi:ERCC4-type nuclease